MANLDAIYRILTIKNIIKLKNEYTMYLKIKLIALLLFLAVTSCKNDFKLPYQKVIERRAIERKNNENGQSVLSGRITIEKFVTGYNSYHIRSSFLPTITLKLKNIGNKDLTEHITISAVFLDNKTGEQLDTDYQTISSSTQRFVSSATMQIQIRSSVGWHYLSEQDVSVKLYINDKYLKTVKIDNREFDGIIR